MSKRRKFLKKMGLGFITIPVLQNPVLPKRNGNKQQNVFFTTGYKVSGVTSNQAIVWTRLCGQQFPNSIVHERREKVFRHPIDFDENMPVDKMDGAVKVANGFVQIKLEAGSGKVFSSGWMEAKEPGDSVVSFLFDELEPNSLYKVVIEGKMTDDGVSSFIYGSFKTAPSPNASKNVILTTSTCQYFWSFDDIDRGFRTYDSMRRMNPDFYIQTGDYVYYDKPGPLAKNLEQARHKWHAMDSRPSIRDLYTKTPVFMIKDDHDLLDNDVFPGSGDYGDLSLEDGLKLWYTNSPVRKKPYRKIRWGKDLEIWLVEGREFRSPNDAEDGPDKSIWGQEQKDWFVRTVEESDATFKLLFTATPVVGPDRENKSDNHANTTFEHEGTWLRKYLSGLKNIFVINGDRHWQYVSKDDETGLLEFGSGPVSDYHVQGWKEGDKRPEHQYLGLVGGFLSVEVKKEGSEPIIIFCHNDVDGRVLNTVKIKKSDL